MIREVREPSPSPCRECGGEGYEIAWVPETRNRLLELGVCLSCLHWLEVVEERNGHVVVDGHAFRPKEDDPDTRVRTGGWGLGCGGAEQHFVLSDGTLLRCCNVWNRGQVPEHFRDRLPDDARRPTPGERDRLDWSRAITHLPREDNSP